MRRRDEQETIGPGRGAADAPTQLIELGEAEAVGAVDQDGVGVGDVDAALDDGRSDEHVGLAGDEAHHDLLELALRHLAMADGDARLGDERGDELGLLFDVEDAMVDEEDLSAARELALYGFADDLLRRLRDEGLYRQAVDRRRLDERDIAQTEHRHVQRPRDGGRRQRQHVDVRLEAFDVLLLGDPEAVLLIDD
jgi:hypothetical protein